MSDNIDFLLWLICFIEIQDGLDQGTLIWDTTRDFLVSQLLFFDVVSLRYFVKRITFHAGYHFRTIHMIPQVDQVSLMYGRFKFFILTRFITPSSNVIIILCRVTVANTVPLFLSNVPDFGCHESRPLEGANAGVGLWLGPGYSWPSDIDVVPVLSCSYIESRWHCVWYCWYLSVWNR